jgi:tetratricopeptide (TPR) repeat protein
MKLTNISKTLFSVLGIGIFVLACGGDSGVDPNKQPPSITEGPQLSDALYNSIVISWRTNIASNSTVRYGTQSGQYDLSKTDDVARSVHEVTLTDLASNTTYFFVIESAAESGSATSSESQFNTLKTLLDFVDEGWQEYENGNYSEAIAEFKGALNHVQVPNKEFGYNGLGWTYAANSVDSLDKSRESFDAAIQRRANLTEAFAGRGFVHLAQKRYNSAIDDFAQTLELDASFVFSHNSDINANDLRLGLAEAYFFKQNLTDAQAQVDLLDPGNGLDPGSSGTWVVDGVTFATYAEALLAWIEKLKSVT